jgi:hypothetical protein
MMTPISMTAAIISANWMHSLKYGLIFGVGEAAGHAIRHLTAGFPLAV